MFPARGMSITISTHFGKGIFTKSLHFTFVYQSGASVGVLPPPWFFANRPFPWKGRDYSVQKNDVNSTLHW
jgi:hypothetical protein